MPEKFRLEQTKAAGNAKSQQLIVEASVLRVFGSPFTATLRGTERYQFLKTSSTLKDAVTGLQRIWTVRTCSCQQVDSGQICVFWLKPFTCPTSLLGVKTSAGLEREHHIDSYCISVFLS